MNVIQKIGKNMGFLFISQFLSYIFGFLYIIYAARYLGVEGYGILAFALSLTSIVGLLADLGLNTLITRELARDYTSTSKYLSNVVIIKTLLSFIVFLLIILIINLFNYPQLTANIVYLITLSYLLTSFSSMFNAIFQAHEKMEYQSVGHILSNLFTFIGVLFVIYLNLDIISVAVVYLVSSILVLFFSFLIFIKNYDFEYMKIDLSFCKFVIMEAIPLSLFIILSALSFKIDTVMLSIIIGDDAVGLYNPPIKLIEALNIFPAILTGAIFPVLSRFHTSSQTSLNSSYSLSFKYLLLISIPISMGTTLLAEPLILFLFGCGFTQSIEALRIIIWAIPFIFLIYLLNLVLISTNNQNIALKINFLGVMLNISLNLVLIPKFSYIGASIVTLITEIFLFSMPYYYISKLLVKIDFGMILVKSIIASIIMGIFIIIINTNLFLEIILSTIIYFSTLILLKTFSEEDYNIFRQLIRFKLKKS